ncbi:MAG: helix-turn-helix domain-containing protein [Acutalibacter sp.]|nr:helix-turn-helix domain-containing protein [Acutalibacter sp.]
MRVKMKQLRESMGFTQHTMGKAIGIERSYYTLIETGERQPSLRVALKIKQVLGYYGDDIFDNTTLGLPNQKSRLSGKK